MALKIVILAAGKGTRMRSNLPKVLQPLAAKPLLSHVIATAELLSPEQVIGVIGHGAEIVKQRIVESNLVWCLQTEQLGTGHAVQQAESFINASDTVLILYGDVPLTRVETLEQLLFLVDEKHPLALLTIELENPSGYGRIVRDSDLFVQQIVEQKDANLEQLAIQEVNTGIMAVNGQQLLGWLAHLSNNNAQGEYYLTDIIAMAVADGYQIQTSSPNDVIEVLGVNNKQQLQDLERQYQFQLACNLMEQGATLIDASRIDIRGNVSVGQDVEIDVNVVFEGQVKLADGVKIGANCVLKDVEIGANTVIKPFSHIDNAKLGQSCQIGPYARIRPDTELADQVHIGNFVEIKKTQVGQGSKVNHLSYIGDTQMGSLVNIGAGTITCNYDGVNKHKTFIGDRVFIGSDSQLVAPVSIGDDATIGAGSTITKTAPEGELTLSRAKQLTIKGWQKPTKKI
ncbi:bifunctional UDP-N-acetylglucosamine diphosphorylase/glucosamine-1-phosphate N-acetyltransferase GlmU [Thiomicrospira microaerophila]|uniref:bifunctional UDP-N-acetylglucosamine diphosphorylase/glucosamine-1-phosphate N-acetyltransferase GlmU n=1 Tax=Thiomicrospira microaerophila TaxID=406020 RepID=UPI002010569C|nr:bifunctional UDP-N-acetylglucosamine diphosphorylase/glucosamine-1-phosphate N-acetyltransferase GlmU [Thiomicrospira microaerophila]UQB42152.1 bifunctional UDP-N-acetylglucosamine diphosphorylase/glucosamine-1-phosphate N-acetyltransferase GlmU [Thiomicrospira microaerophila]